MTPAPDFAGLEIDDEGLGSLCSGIDADDIHI
jgi:hypothetical protein